MQYYLFLPLAQSIPHKMDSRPRYARFLHLRPGIAVMEEVISWLPERNNFSVQPSYAVFGGHLMPRVTGSLLAFAGEEYE